MNNIDNNVDKLYTNGYVHIRNVLDIDLLDKCKEKILSKYNEHNYRNICNNELSNDKDILDLVFNRKNNILINIFKNIHRSGGMYKNINFRYMSKGKFTKEHKDFCPEGYDLYVTWIPMDSYDEFSGTLYINNCIIPVEKGDLIIFRGDILHGTTKNTTDIPRISIDCRWIKTYDYADNSILFWN